MFSRIIDGYRNAFSGVPRNVWLMSVILLVSRSGTMVLPFLAIYGRTELKFEPTTIGWLLSAYGIGGVVAGLVAGKMIEKIGAISTQIITLAMAVPGYLWVGMVTDFFWLIVSMFYLSLTVEAVRPACTTATVDFCAEEHQHVKALAVNRLAVNLGMTLGPALGGFLILISYQLLFYVNAFTTFAACLLTIVFFGWPSGRAKKETGKDKDSKSDVSADAVEDGTKSSSPFADLRFMLFCFINVLAALVFFQFLSTYPLYLKEQYQFQEYHIGLLYAVNTVVIVLFELVLVNWIVRWPLLRIYGWGQLLSCVGFGMLPLGLLFFQDRSVLATNESAFLIGAGYCVFTMIVLTIGEMLAMPLGAAYAARRSNQRNRGKYMGVYIASFSVAALIAPLAGMGLYEIHPDLVGYASLVVGAIVFFALIIMSDSEEKVGRQKDHERVEDAP